MTVVKTYVAEDGSTLFRFAFVHGYREVGVYCARRPGLRGRDPSVVKTHIYQSGQLCFHAGRAPSTQAEAEARAKQWAEYYLRYRATGITEG